MSIEDYPAKLDDGYYHVMVGRKEVGKYKTKKKALEKCEATSESMILLDDGTLVYPEPEEGETEDMVTVSNSGQDDAAEEPGKTVATGTDQEKYGIVQAFLNVREEPSIDAMVLTRLAKGTIIDILEDCGEWLALHYPGAPKNGKAYVYAEYVKTGRFRYPVVKGDTLASIAKKVDTTEEAIMELNGISSRIRIGQVLILP